MTVAIGGIIGFPLLTTLSLQYVGSAHSIVFIGLLPLATTFFAVIRARERPRKLFWFFSVIGSLFVIGFALFQGGKSTLLIGLKLSTWLLNETVNGVMIASTCGVTLCVAAPKKYAK